MFQSFHRRLFKTVVRLIKNHEKNYSKSTSLCSKKQTRTKEPYKVEIKEFAPSKLQLEFNRVGTLVDGSVIATCGDTSVIVTAAASYSQTSSVLVDYKLRPVAHNRLRTHPYANTFLLRLPLLCARAVDRSVRVCIPSDANQSIQVDCVVLSNDLSGDHLLLAINGIHAVLSTTKIPYYGPMAAVRVGCIDDGEFILNPTAHQLRRSKLNLLMVVDGKKSIVMIEIEAANVPHDIISEALDFGMHHGTKLAARFRKMAKNNAIKDPATHEIVEERSNLIGPEWENKLEKILLDTTHSKNSRDVAYESLRCKIMKKYEKVSQEALDNALQAMRKDMTNKLAVENNHRLDGRKAHELRPINSEVDYIKYAHGSAQFQRGETQVIASVTFDGEATRKTTKGILYSVGIEDRSNFSLDYYFHSFCTRTGHIDAANRAPAGLSRREVGHATLGEKALRPLIPDNFPFNIKITSDVTDSSGSTSMATVCAGCLALMDAGVQISEPAAGVALGLAAIDPKDPDKFILLNDIQGFEDHSGFMDLKIGGTKNGITVAQLDTKIPGLPLDFIKRCIYFGQISIGEVITRMTTSAGLNEPRPDLKDNAPVLKILNISEHEALRFIGRMASHRRMLETEYGIQISLEEDGLHVYAPNEQILKEAEAELDRYYQPKPPDLVPNNIYEALIVGKSERQFSLRIHPNMDDVTIDVSQVTSKLIQSTESSGFDIGDKIKVKYFGRDPVSGKMRFSRTAMLITSEKVVNKPKKKSITDLLNKSV